MTDCDSILRVAKETEKITGGSLVHIIATAGDFRALYVRQHRRAPLSIFFSHALVLRGKAKVIALSSASANIKLQRKYDIELSPTYTASKAAFNAIVAKFSAQYARDGVLIMSICPRMVDTQTLDGGKLLRLDTLTLEFELITVLVIVIDAQKEGFAGFIRSDAPHFAGPKTAESAAEDLLALISRCSIENGNGGSLMCHLRPFHIQENRINNLKDTKKDLIQKPILVLSTPRQLRSTPWNMSRAADGISNQEFIQQFDKFVAGYIVYRWFYITPPTDPDTTCSLLLNNCVQGSFEESESGPPGPDSACPVANIGLSGLQTTRIRITALLQTWLAARESVSGGWSKISSRLSFLSVFWESADALKDFQQSPLCGEFLRGLGRESELLLSLQYDCGFCMGEIPDQPDDLHSRMTLAILNGCEDLRVPPAFHWNAYARVDGGQKEQLIAADTGSGRALCYLFFRWNDKGASAEREGASVSRAHFGIALEEHAPVKDMKDLVGESRAFGHRGGSIVTVTPRDSIETSAVTTEPRQENVNTPPTKSDLLSKAGDAAEDTAETAAEQLALDVAANAFFRVAVPALLAPLELIEELIPFVGKFGHVNEKSLWRLEITFVDKGRIAATPALIRLCVKGIEEGKAEFRVFGKKQSLTLDTKTKPVSTRLLSSSYKSTPASTANYNSVTQRIPAYKTLKCPLASKARPARPWRDRWYKDHNADWYNGFMKENDVRCEADEYPPAAFWQGALSPKQYIRFSPGRQNGGAGSLFGLGFCEYDDQGHPPVETANKRYVGDLVVGGLKRRVTQYMARTTRRAVRIDFIKIVDPDGVAGLSVNPCWPEILLEDPGFALLTDDPYYAAHRDVQRYAKANYPNLIPLNALRNHTPQQGYRKQDEKSHGLDPEAWVFDDGNSTRRVTEDELVRYLGFLRCNSADCHEEMHELGIKSAPVVEAPETSHHLAVPMTFASRTQSASDITTTDVFGKASAGSGAAALLEIPTQTDL
ncbi:hypothetical protein GGR58DRAFT_501952 [Xylaria digitata]|nr:hypothetical protein GGR58DRAFT_501952 [Xylaria digitata]